MVEYRKSAGAVVYLKNDKGKIFFLLLKNTLKRTYWEFPKGKIEENEGLKETVKREVKEETNLENFEIISDFKHINEWYFRLKGETIKKKAVFLLVRVSKEEGDKVKINYEHQDFDWLTYKEAKKRIKIRDNKKMLKRAYKFIKKYEKQKKLF